MNLSTIKSPGVYIQEIDSFGNSVVPVPTALPIFIGYTEKADFNGKSLTNTPTKISSLLDYEQLFGKAPFTTFSIDETKEATYDFVENNKKYTLNVQNGNYLLYNQLQFFYLNGGQDCYIISVGDYTQPIDEKTLISGIDIAKTSGETADASLLLCPDATLLPTVELYGSVAQQMLLQCGEMKSRFSIIDVYEGYKGLDTTVIEDFRTAVSTNNLSYGGAYYPYLHTTIVQTDEISYTQITNEDALDKLLAAEGKVQPIKDLKEKMDEATLNNYLIGASKIFSMICNAICLKLNVQPPSGAMAGIYTSVDNAEGVWHSPANYGVLSVVKPVIPINNDEQAPLNVDAATGKSINAIRFFNGMGTLVWGARTLDGNNYDWRYIQVRRTIIYIEQSIKAAVRAYVFAPNDSNTWKAVTALCSNFLTQLWQQGGLMGAKATDAFTVQCGLGSTMTSEDISNGYLNVSVGVSVTHPAEFIIIEIQQQMATSS